ncbi:hypothetical protein G8O24_25995 [Bradyrhizobium sp. INPA01-394B]|uniref:Uncharacterized protein n=1 Tax=Bradyrhizobium campsiandrae TaxID=1729892 RepID=A0ABR7UGZ2_9BRAD|nr:hypothetical protein [Bradyrhizobium campsiandrae]MBC9880782.1 hypothetical protein [Bradyrhizobium campsiandrae]MBC9982742.1 hypothetical protein [Bradyrhizobium campsiandrae]
MANRGEGCNLQGLFASLLVIPVIASGAKQSRLSLLRTWIASSQALLAMTVEAVARAAASIVSAIMELAPTSFAIDKLISHYLIYRHNNPPRQSGP